MTEPVVNDPFATPEKKSRARRGSLAGDVGILNCDTNVVRRADELLSPFSQLAVSNASRFNMVIEYMTDITSPRFDRKFDFGEQEDPGAPPDDELPPIPLDADAPMKFLWRREHPWERQEVDIMACVKKVIWTFYYNSDDHRVELVHNTITGFRAVAFAGQILLEEKGDAKDWFCPCTAKSRHTQASFTLKICISKVNESYVYELKLDDQPFASTKDAFLNGTGAPVVTAFANHLAEGKTLSSPSLKVLDKTMIHQTNDSVTSITGKWKIIHTWTFHVMGVEAAVRLEHGATGKKQIEVDGKVVESEKGQNGSSMHVLLVAGLHVKLLIRTRVGMDVSDRNTYVYELKIEGVDFKNMRSFQI